MQFFDIAALAIPAIVPSLKKYPKLREALVDEAISKEPGTRQEAHRLLDELLAGTSYIVLGDHEIDAEKAWWTGKTCVEYLDVNGADGWSQRQFAAWLETGIDELFKSWKSKEAQAATTEQ